jgi:transposase
LDCRTVPEARSVGGPVRRLAQHGPLDREGDEVERATQVPELDGAAEDRDRVGRPARRPFKEVCREHAISEALCYGWREKLLEGGREALAGKEERQAERELRRKVAELERALGRKTYELEIPGKLLREWE